LFVTSVAIGLITTVAAYNRGPSGDTTANVTLVDQFNTFRPSGPSSIPSIPTRVLSKLHSIAGVRAITTIHTAPQVRTVTLHGPPARRIHLTAPPSGVVSCAQLARTPALGRCAHSAHVVAVWPLFGGRDATGPGSVWPAVSISPTRLDRSPVEFIVVGTDGSTSAIEQARTVLQRAYPYLYSPTTIAEDQAQNPNTKLTSQYQQLADVVILSSLLIAGCSLAVSVAAGRSDRKRPFSLLRLTGAPLNMLRHVIALESAVPLLVVSALSIATGFLAAAMFLRSQLSESLGAPSAAYYVIVVVGLVASLAIIASTLPLLKRITGPETARNE
jgi:FtsX-like permease family